MVDSYLQDPVVLYDTTVVQWQISVMSSVAEGLRLGPDFLNVLYGSLLGTELPVKTHLVGYANDVGSLIVV